MAKKRFFWPFFQKKFFVAISLKLRKLIRSVKITLTLKIIFKCFYTTTKSPNLKIYTKFATTTKR